MPVNDTTPFPKGFELAKYTGHDNSPIDLWSDDGPAKDIAGTKYSGYLFNDFAVNAIDTHNTTAGPLFMYLAPANSHTPLQAPQRFLELYPDDW